MRRSGLFLVWSIVLSASASLDAQNLNVEVTVRTVDYGRGELVKGSQIEVTVTPPSERMTERTGRYMFRKVIPNGNDVKTITLEIAPPQTYAGSKLTLRRLPPDKKHLVRDVTAYLVANGVAIDDDSLEQGKKLFVTEEFAKALAFFDYAYRHVPLGRISQYTVKIQYNYARSSFEACNKYGYDTCSTATRLCKELGSLFDEHRKVFDREGITKAMLDQCQQVPAQVAAREKSQEIIYIWADAEQVFQEGDHKTAASRMEEILGEYDTNAQLWRANGKPKWSIEGDAGVAYLKYADFLEANPENLDAPKTGEFLQKSKLHLESALASGDPRKSTKENLDLVKTKLALVKSE